MTRFLPSRKADPEGSCGDGSTTLESWHRRRSSRSVHRRCCPQAATSGKHSYARRRRTSLSFSSTGRQA